jgi:hypothetical protein
MLIKYTTFLCRFLDSPVGGSFTDNLKSLKGLLTVTGYLKQTGKNIEIALIYINVKAAKLGTARNFLSGKREGDTEIA